MTDQHIEEEFKRLYPDLSRRTDCAEKDFVKNGFATGMKNRPEINKACPKCGDTNIGRLTTRKMMCHGCYEEWEEPEDKVCSETVAPPKDCPMFVKGKIDNCAYYKNVRCSDKPCIMSHCVNISEPPYSTEDSKEDIINDVGFDPNWD